MAPNVIKLQDEIMAPDLIEDQPDDIIRRINDNPRLMFSIVECDEIMDILPLLTRNAVNIIMQLATYIREDSIRVAGNNMDAIREANRYFWELRDVYADMNYIGD